MTDANPLRIGRYELRDRLGAGGMARVYQAWDTTLQRLVAIKILHEHLAEDPSFKERFEREARMVAGFNHPNIVQLYDFDSVTLNGFLQYYMVMSYIPGTTLRRELDLTAPNGLGRARVRQISSDLSAALGYAHERGMVHRDVKPGNVLINEKGQAVLADFGIARIAQSTRLTQDGSSTGTPAYMSPEQASGEAGDARSDLYALGVIQFEMLTGQTPYLDEGSMAVMLKHISAPIPVYSERAGEGSRALDRYFERALAKGADDRFQSATAQERAFEAALDGVLPEALPAGESGTVIAPVPVASATPSQPVTATPQPTRQSTGMVAALTQTVKRNPRASGSFLVLAAIIVVLLVTVLVIGRASQTPDPAENAWSGPTLTGENFFYTRFRSETPDESYWPQEADPPFTYQIEDEIYRASISIPFTAETVLYQGGDAYDDILVYMDGTLAPGSAPASAFGIVFRYQDANNYNVFAVDGEGRFSIWARENGQWRELRNDAAGQWTTSEAIRPIGEPNVLTLEVRGNQLTGYVNNQKVTQVFDETFGPGRVGLYVGSDDGASTALIEEYRVRDVTASMTGP